MADVQPLRALHYDLPTVGASGAVAGIIAAYLILHPRVRLWVLALNFIPLRITAGLALGLWIGLQVLMVALHDQGETADKDGQGTGFTRLQANKNGDQYNPSLIDLAP